MTPRSVRKAAAVSQVMLILWVIQSIGVYLYQDVVLYNVLNIVPSEGSGRVVYTAGFLYLAAGILITIADILMQKGKCVYAPLIISAVTTGGTAPCCPYGKQLSASDDGGFERHGGAYHIKLLRQFCGCFRIPDLCSCYRNDRSLGGLLIRLKS